MTKRYAYVNPIIEAIEEQEKEDILRSKGRIRHCKRAILEADFLGELDEPDLEDTGIPILLEEHFEVENLYNSKIADDVMDYTLAEIE